MNVVRGDQRAAPWETMPAQRVACAAAALVQRFIANTEH